MRVIVPFSYCLAHSLGLFGAAEVVIGLVLAIWLLFRRPLLFRQPLWSSSRYVLLLRTALCLLATRSPVSNPFICRLLLCFLASPFTWLLIGHAVATLCISEVSPSPFSAFRFD